MACDVKQSKVSIGAAGEHLVAAELERRGYNVGFTGKNAQLVDLLAQHRESLKTISIQVKTTVVKARSWSLNVKNEKVYDPSFVYIFVKIIEDQKPEFFIVPSEVVAKTLASDFKKWIETPDKNGQPHDPENTLRKFDDPDGKFLNKWENLEYWRK